MVWASVEVFWPVVAVAGLRPVPGPGLSWSNRLRTSASPRHTHRDTNLSWPLQPDTSINTNTRLDLRTVWDSLQRNRIS